MLQVHSRSEVSAYNHTIDRAPRTSQISQTAFPFTEATMDYTTWLASARQNRSYEPAALGALSSYLSYEISPHDAAERIVAAEARLSPLQGGLIWGGLLYLGENDPEVHEQLVDLIKAITSLPNQPRNSLGTAWRDTHDCKSNLNPLFSVSGLIYLSLPPRLTVSAIACSLSVLSVN